MIQGFYTAKTALKYRQTGIDVISNNFANVNTDGYKKDKASFEDALYNLSIKQYPGGDRTYYAIGSGSIVSSINKDFSQGSLLETGNGLDLALDGIGFLNVANDEGDIYYTRGGSFKLTPAIETGYQNIITDAGYYLLDNQGEKISIPEGSYQLSIKETGDVSYLIGEGEENTNPQRLMLTSFNSPENLISYGMGMYGVSELSGEPFVTDKISVLQGFKEGSNVDLASEMVNLMMNQRIYEFNSRIIQTADEMESTSNNLRK
jgi:flagellar basal-body rod protein FlgG